MKVSIIVPVYNCEKYINKCIESVISQSYKDWELILVDDGSKDKSYSICMEYKNKDKRIIVLTQKNKGAGAARNYGIDNSTGEYMIFCDSDDFLPENSLQKFMEFASENKWDLIISGYNEFKYDINKKVKFCGKNDSIDKEILSQKEAREYYMTLYKKCLNQAPWAKLYKSNIVKENKVYFGDFRRCQDTVFNIRYYEYVKTIKIINDKLYNYQTPDGNTYISKFPCNMIDIRKEIDFLITNKLKEWNVYNEDTHNYLNGILAVDILVCSRLNYLNNWNFTKDEQYEYINNLLKDKKVKEVLNNRNYGFQKNICCLILKTNNHKLINLMNSIVLLLQKIKNR